MTPPVSSTSPMALELHGWIVHGKAKCLPCITMAQGKPMFQTDEAILAGAPKSCRLALTLTYG